MKRCAWFLVALAGCHEGAPEEGRLRVAPYAGWTEAVFLGSGDSRVGVTEIPAAGGRIVSFSLDRENILFDNPDYLGKTLANTPPGELKQGYIGYNVDLGPELRRLPDHLALWMGPFAWIRQKEGVHLFSPIDPAVGIRIDKELRLDPGSGELFLNQTMTNQGSSVQSYCLWDRTLCKGGGFALVPLARNSRFRAGWSLLKDGAYQGDAPSDPRVRLIDGVLVAEARGTSAKLGVDSDAGWIAYARGKRLLIKYFPHFPGQPYTDGGNSVEVYFDPKVCELEPLSPERALAPGQSYSFPERWRLLELEEDVTGPDQARSLVERIGRSPFGS